MLPVLRTVMAIRPLVELTLWLAKVYEAGLTEAALRPWRGEERRLPDAAPIGGRDQHVRGSRCGAALRATAGRREARRRRPTSNRRTLPAVGNLGCKVNARVSGHVNRVGVCGSIARLLAGA